MLVNEASIKTSQKQYAMRISGCNRYAPETSGCNSYAPVNFVQPARRSYLRSISGNEGSIQCQIDWCRSGSRRFPGRLVRRAVPNPGRGWPDAGHGIRSRDPEVGRFTGHSSEVRSTDAHVQRHVSGRNSEVGVAGF